MEPTSTYRADIDGLRAVAVLLVVFYHFGLGPSGGFIGVDVFFVISGYLITGILAREISSNQFSLVRFYERRVRRIVPALLAVIAASICAGWFWLMPGDYVSLGWQGATAALGISNFYFLQNTDYFAANAELMPLLHTWSLAVEEQFYLFWPIMLGLTWKASRSFVKAARTVLVAIIFGSFIVSLWLVEIDKPLAFYMLPSRAWEMALGSLLVFVPAIRTSWLSQGAPALGLLLIAGPSILLTSETPFPGLAALAPCIGAALVIWPRSAPSVASNILSLWPARFIGWISYSLYLWHWPIVVYFRHVNFEQLPNAIEAMALIVACIGIATLSWHFIEKPFRRSAGEKPRTPVVIGGMSIAAIACFSLSVVALSGLPGRLPSRIQSLAQSVDDFSPSRELCHRGSEPFSLPLENSCVLGGEEPTAAMWADSHGVELGEALGEVYGRNNEGLMLLTASACAPAMAYDAPERPQCMDYNSAVLSYLISHPTITTVYLVRLLPPVLLSCGPAMLRASKHR